MCLLFASYCKLTKERGIVLRACWWESSRVFLIFSFQLGNINKKWALTILLRFIHRHVRVLTLSFIILKFISCIHSFSNILSHYCSRKCVSYPNARWCVDVCVNLHSVLSSDPLNLNDYVDQLSPRERAYWARGGGVLSWIRDKTQEREIMRSR